MSCDEYKKPNILDRQKECIADIKNFELTKGRDTLTVDRYVEEQLNIGGADLNVFKLLGVHEQGMLIDLAKDGRAISGGDGSTNHLAANVFDRMCGSWRSKQTGTATINNAFLGYDFGPIRDVENDREIYGVETRITKHITTIMLEQSDDPLMRANRVRVERSLDGITWKGVDVIELVDDGELNTYNIKGSASSRFWRLRVIDFSAENKNWEVNEVQLMEYEKTSLYNIQDEMGFLEARDRDYAKEPISIKGAYDLLDTLTTNTGWGTYPSTQNLYFMISLSSCIRKLGRLMVVGDIFELPNEMQYTPELVGIKKYMEVIDVAWSTEGYAPGWTPLLLRVVAVPMLSTQETMDITGHSVKPDEMGFLDIDDSGYADQTDVDDRFESQADFNVPERGEDVYDRAVIPDELADAAAEHGINVTKLGTNQKRLYVEDGLPPGGEPYTEGDDYPADPKDNDYHRLTYSNVGDNIPPRLFRFSTIKNRWLYLETDRRLQYNRTRPTLQNFISSDESKPTSNITGDDR